jgi:succinyl-CoA synthetase alpha subunit
MGILIGASTRAIVQGITGKQGSYQTKLMLDYGTKILAGVSPGKGGNTIHGLPVFDTVEEAVESYSPDASIIFVPAKYAQDAAMEAIANKIKTIVVITEHIPVKDSINMVAAAAQSQISIVGPNTPGIITPKECKLGIMPANIFSPGAVGLVSRSGTLAYEVAVGLIAEGLGVSTCFGVGGDPVVGLNFIDALKLFRKDAETEAVVLIGEIGGDMEEQTAEFLARNSYPKPVVAYVAGRFAPTGKIMGHAGAIIAGKQGTAKSKIEAFSSAGVKIAEKPNDIARIVGELISKN